MRLSVLGPEAVGVLRKLLGNTGLCRMKGGSSWSVLPFLDLCGFLAGRQIPKGAVNLLLCSLFSPGDFCKERGFVTHGLKKVSMCGGRIQSSDSVYDVVFKGGGNLGIVESQPYKIHCQVNYMNGDNIYICRHVYTFPSHFVQLGTLKLC